MSRIRTLAGTAVVAAALLAIPAPAMAKSGDVIRTGDCSGRADWKIKVSPENGALEVEFEVDSNRNGQRWTYTLRHDGVVKASGTRTTQAPSGSFSVERRLPNAPGVHSISATAANASTGETCQASLKI